MKKSTYLKNFMYFENGGGGMETHVVTKERDLEALYGWMDTTCEADDRALLNWMALAEVGTVYYHRLGIMVRLKDELRSEEWTLTRR